MGFLLTDNQGNPLEFRRAAAGATGQWMVVPDDDPRIALITKQPNWQNFIALFETPGNTLYEGVLSKVAESGFLVQNHWLNLKSIILYTHNTQALAIAINHLKTLLNNAGHPLTQQDISGWNALMMQCDFPANCQLQ